MKPESSRLPHTDNAVFGPQRGGAQEPTYGGVLSFMRRRYSRDLHLQFLRQRIDHRHADAVQAA